MEILMTRLFNEGDFISHQKFQKSIKKARFRGWDIDPLNKKITEDTTFTVLKNRNSSLLLNQIPWWRRFGFFNW